MQTMLQNNSRVEGHLKNTVFMRAITAGLIGGLAGTIGSRGKSNGTCVNVRPAR